MKGYRKLRIRPSAAELAARQKKQEELERRLAAIAAGAQQPAQAKETEAKDAA